MWSQMAQLRSEMMEMRAFLGTGSQMAQLSSEMAEMRAALGSQQEQAMRHIVMLN